MKLIKLKESDLVNTIKNILNEQSGGNLIPENGYKAISKIESAYSFTDPTTGKIKGGEYTGKEKEPYIRDYIDATIGTDNWFKMDELFRTQLYAYMYQTDSNGPMRMWWIAGLAQAIDSKIDRASISKKPLSDPNVIEAIDLIKKACQDFSINKYYNSWLKVVDNQYSVTGSAHKDNYKNVWKNRPKAIARLMKGDNWETVKKEFNSDTTTAPQQQKTTTQQPSQQQKTTTQQPVAQQQKTASAQGVGLMELLEKVLDYRMADYATPGRPNNTSLKINSPLLGDNIFFTIQNKVFGCEWGYDIKEPFYDDNMKLQLTNQDGKITATVVTGDGDKLPANINGMNCRQIR